MIHGLILDPRAWSVDYTSSPFWMPEKYGVKVDLHPNFSNIPKLGVDKKYKFVIATEVWEIPMRKSLEYLRKKGLKIFFAPREPFKTDILEDVMFKYPKFLYNGEYYFTPDMLLAPNRVYAGFWKGKTKTVVTGYPKFDYLVNAKQRKTNEKKTIFFPSYPPYYHRTDGFTDIYDGREETLKALAEFAKNNRDYRVVVKIHPMSFKCYRKGTGNKKEVSGTLLEYYKNPTDYMVVKGDDRMSGDIAKNILFDADVVVGFTSTMLLEALAIDKQVVHVLLGNTKDVNFTAYQDHLPTAYTKEEMFDLIKNPREVKDKEDLVERYLFKVDGGSCKRICEAIYKEKEMKTFVIAEVGINHEGSLEKAKELIAAAKESDADAVKLQTYQTPLRVNADNQFFGLLKDCETTYEEQVEMKEYADKIGIEFFSTTFDKISTKFLIEDLGMKKIKVASFDCSNKDLLSDINSYSDKHDGLHVILSVGMSSTTEIFEALECLKDVEVTLLHCVSSYPCPPEEANLLGIRTLKELTCGQFPVGYSDHTPDIIIPSAAVLLGATTIEKHFTLDKNDSAVDNPVSADPSMFKEMVRLIRGYEAARGTGSLGLKEVEKFFTIFKRVT